MTSDFQQVAKILNEGIILELKLQGHLFLEELESTIRTNVKIKEQKNVITLEGSAVEYIQKMEFGVRPTELGSRQEHLRKLFGFYLKFGYDPKMAMIKAMRLLPHHFQEGTPTEFSNVYSKTGERKGFISATWKKKETEVDAVVDNGIEAMFMNEFNLQKSETI
ncbi:hypothetical protein [Chryseobacterium gambrini]|uniref:hypothetical protein n=1 Tax=Chryseobacterium gambrini TaxID=373672 RepID=UPI003D0FE842